MNRPLILSLLLLVAGAQGCSFNRANVADLVDQQQAYYGDLRALLIDQKNSLERGLAQKVKTSSERRQNLADWALDLQKAEVLLQVDADVTGNQRLLSYKLAEIDLAATENAERDRTDAEQAAAIIDMYDGLIRATAALEKNSAVLAEYFAAGDKEFALRNLDTDGIVRAVAGIREVQETLGSIEKRSDEAKAAEQEKLRRSIDRARDVLLKVFAEGEEG